MSSAANEIAVKLLEAFGLDPKAKKATIELLPCEPVKITVEYYGEHEGDFNDIKEIIKEYEVIKKED